MRPQHLSDEAVAAFADGVLTGHARERARRHTAECPECGYSVAVQREAVWALRAAPAPALPSGLFARLLDVPATTPIRVTPTSIAEDGSTMFSTFGSMAPVGVAAAAPPQKERRGHRLGPIAGTAAAVAVAGVLVVGSAGHASGQQRPSIPNPPANVAPAHVQPAGYVVAR
ncbi:MAG: zf-HC2 domain-containing protein [Jatrophihabitantaceae bacterium]